MLVQGEVPLHYMISFAFLYSKTTEKQFLCYFWLPTAETAEPSWAGVAGRQLQKGRCGRDEEGERCREGVQGGVAGCRVLNPCDKYAIIEGGNVPFGAQANFPSLASCDLSSDFDLVNILF